MKKTIAILISILLFVVSFNFCFAGTLFNTSVACMDTGNCNTTDMLNVAVGVTKYLMGLIGSIALLFFIIAGIKMLTSHGNSSQISSAKTMMVQTIIGIIVCLSAYVIVNTISTTFLTNPIELDESFEAQK